MQPCDIATYAASFLGGGIIGAVIGGWSAHKYTQSREKETRRFNFRCLLGEWRVKALLSEPKEIISDFPKDASRFGGAYVALEPDLSHSERETFHRLCDDIIGTPATDTQQYKADLLSKIQGLIEATDLAAKYPRPVCEVS